MRTGIERESDPEAVPRLKGDARHDITVNGPGLAAHALRAGLVDELQMFVCPALVGAGQRFFPDHVRLKPELVDGHGFRNRVVVLGYAVRWLVFGAVGGRGLQVAAGGVRAKPKKTPEIHVGRLRNSVFAQKGAPR
jgi:hypothetical protein